MTESEAGSRAGWLGLTGMIAACITVTVGLWRLTGPPTSLTTLPHWSHVQNVLSGSRLSDQDVITVATGIAWLVVIYLLLAITVRLLLGLAAVLTGQAAWVRGGLRVTAPLTLPIVRRVVDGALAGTILVSATFHTPSAALASSAAISASAEAPLGRTTSFDGPGTNRLTETTPETSAETVPATYSVLRGDHLWGIAERFLGDGFRWVDIWKLNQQRTMTDGRTFVDPNLIHPGWELELPDGVGTLEPESFVEDDGVGITPEPEATPEPSPKPQTAEPTEVAPATIPAVSPGGPVVSAGDHGGPELLPSLPTVPLPSGEVVAAATAITIGGAAMLLVFRRDRHRARRSSGHPERRPAGSGDAARVLATSTALLTALSELDFAATDIVLVRESDRYLEFSLNCPPGDTEALVASSYTLGRQLGCAVDGELLAPTMVRLKLSRMNQLAVALLADIADGDRPLLVPVGASDSGIHYLNLAAVGSVLVAGGRLEGRDLLTSWFTTLDSLHPGGTVTAVADEAAWGSLHDCMDLLPGPPDASSPADSPAALARWLETKLIAREEEPDPPVLLALLGLNSEPARAVTEMEGVLRQGPERGIFVIAFADTNEGAETQWSFGTSVVFSEDEHLGRASVITVTVPNLTPLHVEPVVVRRQVAQRPRRDAETAAQFPPASPTPPPSQNGHAPSERWQGDDEVPADNDDPGAEDRVPRPSANGTHAIDRAPVPDELGPSSPPPMDRQASLPLERDNGPGTDDRPVYRARLFGTFCVETDAGEVNGWSIQKARELLAYLLAHGGTPVLRDTAAEALGLSAENQGGHPLPNAAYYVRRTLSRAVPDLEGEILITARQRYALRAGLFRTDVDAFDAHLARAERLQGHEALVEYQRALEICTADFLADEDYEWADAYRRDYQKRFIAAADRAAKLACDLRDPKLALRFYGATLQRDPIDEDAVRGAMRCHIALGDQNSAKRMYKKLVEDLRQALDDDDAEPMPETTKVLEQLQASKRAG